MHENLAGSIVKIWMTGSSAWMIWSTLLKDDMGGFFLPPHVSFHETFFRGKDNFQLLKKKK